MMNSKKGAEKITSIYWFLVLVLVAFGIWAMAYAYFMHPLDVREIESRVLNNKAADCISQNGKMPVNLFDSEGNFSLDKDNFLNTCHFNFQVEDQYSWRDRGQYYAEISFFDVNEKEKFSKVSFGEPTIKTDCEKIQEKQTFERVSKCTKKRLYVLDNKNQQTLVEIFTGVRKTQKNVKI